MSPRESNPDRLSQRLQGSDAIVGATDAARAFGSSLGLADSELARLCIVIEELVANLYDHGGLSDHDIVELSLCRDADGIRVVIVNPGPPFDPWAAAQPNMDQPDRGGGAGIALVRAWAQFVSYDSSAEGNRMEFVLPL